MRDIKFRAWDNLEKRMRKVVSLHWQGDKLVSARLEGDNEPIPIERRLVIEKFISLKDENNKNIYAEDIVEVKHSDWTEPTIHVVKWCGDEKYTAFNLKPELDEAVNSIALVAQSDFFSVKVVGNIHENPELLEEK
jgi:uncharacterized phage protein (TIGR01671 family)